MSGDNFYLITSLPQLGEFGSLPPIGLEELAERVAVSPAAQLVEAILTGDDLLQRDAFLAGEIEQVVPAVLTPQQVRNEQPLPEFLLAEVADESTSPRASADSLWARYFHYLHSVARRRHSRFLDEWTANEVGVRNALASARAKALGLDPANYMVAPELGADQQQFDDLVSEWASAPEPLSALKILDRARWDWLTEHERYYSFADDELAAYAAKLMLLHRWQKLTAAATARQR